jgi:hypothetical protein
MHAGLAKLVHDYQRAVARAVALLSAAGIPRPDSNGAWAGANVPGRGDLAGGARYYKHGFGCAVRAPSWHVDFDFGDAGEIDGFDPSRLSSFAGSTLAEYGFETENQLKTAFAAAVEADELRFSGYISYYLVAGAGETEPR